LKLLFDANLSPKLAGRLAELFPDSVHVSDTPFARTARVEELLRRHAIRIAELEQSPRPVLVIRST